MTSMLDLMTTLLTKEKEPTVALIRAPRKQDSLARQSWVLEENVYLKCKLTNKTMMDNLTT